MSHEASEVFEREFLPLRGRLIEVAAALDRVARAEGAVDDDPRMKQVRQTLGLLATEAHDSNRAELAQMIFSLPYVAQWRDESSRP